MDIRKQVPWLTSKNKTNRDPRTFVSPFHSSSLSGLGHGSLHPNLDAAPTLALGPARPLPPLQRAWALLQPQHPRSLCAATTALCLSGGAVEDGGVCDIEGGRSDELGEAGVHLAHDLRAGLLRRGDDAHGCRPLRSRPLRHHFPPQSSPVRLHDCRRHSHQQDGPRSPQVGFPSFFFFLVNFLFGCRENEMCGIFFWMNKMCGILGWLNYLFHYPFSFCLPVVCYVFVIVGFV